MKANLLKFGRNWVCAAGLAAVMAPAPALALVVIQDNFTGQNSASGNAASLAAGTATQWALVGPPALPGTVTQILNGVPCLTAGYGSGANNTTNTSIPYCSQPYSYYVNSGSSGSVTSATPTPGVNSSLPDPPGQGALRLTDKFNYMSSGIVSTTPFPTQDGVRIQFTTYTWGGSGADGISFALLDSSFYTLTQSLVGQPSIAYSASSGFGNQAIVTMGAVGGSIGYSCNNASDKLPNGYIGGYIGLGIDEYGNFLNSGDNTASGADSSYNVVSNGQAINNRIGLRGAGSVNWYWLNKNYPNYYPSSLTTAQQVLATRATCQSGYLQDWSRATARSTSGTATSTTVPDYAPITSTSGSAAALILPNSTPISGGSSRTTANPIIYKLILTKTGLLSLSYSYKGGAFSPVLTNQSVTSNNGPLPANLLFAFGASTGGANNIHEITCFQAVPANAGTATAAVNANISQTIQTVTNVFLASYYTANPQTNVDGWWGTLVSKALQITSSGAVSIAPTATWDASCALTGDTLMYDQKCDNTGYSTTTPTRSPSSRVMLASKGFSTNAVGGVGESFEWPGDTNDANSTAASTITSAQQTQLGSSSVLDYLRGDRSQEGSGSGTLRTRLSVLGDIIDSSPTFVGPPSQSAYLGAWSDKLYPTTAPTPQENSTSYATFQSNYANRRGVLYVGANDGWLHGFAAGGGSNNTANNTGSELLAFMPANTIATINSNATPTLDLPNYQFGHNYFVDGSLGSGDLIMYTNNSNNSGTAWHTVLVSGLGWGGSSGNSGTGYTSSNSSLFMLDVTNPGTGSGSVGDLSEATPNNVVLGEWNASSLTSTNCTLRLPSGSSGVTCANEFGNIMGAPQIRRLHNGHWGVIFGNGLYSTKGGAGIYVMDLSPTSTAVQFYYLDSGDAAASNGISDVAAVDLDGDNIVDYVYGGDVLGNMWRFDLTSTSPSNWIVTDYNVGATNGTNSSPVGNHPLFITGNSANGSSVHMPITVAPVVLTVTAPVANRTKKIVMVLFGTGQAFPITASVAASYSTATHSFYGIWDWNMAAWNAVSSTNFATVTTPISCCVSNGTISGTSNLNSQVLSTDSQGNRTISNNSVCWYGGTGDSTCGGVFNNWGWYFNLPSANEQVVAGLTYNNNVVYFNTLIPPSNSACNQGQPTGFTMAVSVLTGGAVTSGAGNTAATTSAFTSLNDSNLFVAGTQLNATGSLQLVQVVYNGPGGATATTQGLVYQNVSGTGGFIQTAFNYAAASAAGNSGYRMNWMQLR